MVRVDAALVRQIRHLLHKFHKPRVNVQPSKILDAGIGVYANDSVKIEQLPYVTCLYPGVYTPGLPKYLLRAGNDDTAYGSRYLAHHVPPSGIKMEENAYVLNLKECGGYLDGCALTPKEESQCATLSPSRLDENPSACGHLINHDAVNANIEVASFFWGDIIKQIGQDEDDNLFHIPNRFRCDGSPWFFDAHDQTIVTFPTEPATSFIVRTGGAAMVLTKQAEKGEEILLNYGLKVPYPRWANDWYRK